MWRRNKIKTLQPQRLNGFSLNKTRKIFITYQYFLPGYKAGGPIQSIANLCRHMQGNYKFYIVCSDTDHTENKPLQAIKSDVWNEFEGGKAMVYYVSKPMQKAKTIARLLKEVSPDYVFINGLYSPLFTISPLFYAKCRTIISVRGMLHPGALSQKAAKKRIFIALLKLFQVHKRVTFHATDETEKAFILNTFGNKANVIVAQNFPNTNMLSKNAEKIGGELKLLSIALISPMKNHALILEALKYIKTNVCYDIYGPVKDDAYWDACKQLIKGLPSNIKVSYKGGVEPHKVAKLLSNYHCFILPSKSENFGHAIYEALSAGLPVITSQYTPWNNLKTSMAGYNIDIADVNSLVAAIEHMAALDNSSYRLWSQGARQCAVENISVEKIKVQYEALFASN